MKIKNVKKNRLIIKIDEPVLMLVSDDSLVSYLRIIVLVEKGTNDVVDKLVFAVEHIKSKGCNKGDESNKDNFPEKLCKELNNRFHCQTAFP